METFSIYVLMCPETGKVRYVGRTQDSSYRKLHHRHGYGVSPVDRWKRRLAAIGKRAVFRVIEEVEGTMLAKWREHWWIRYFRHQGQPILNVNTISAKTARAWHFPPKTPKYRRGIDRIDPAEFFDLSVFRNAGDHLAI